MKYKKLLLLTLVFIALIVVEVLFLYRQEEQEKNKLECKPFDSKLWEESHQDMDNPRIGLLSTLRHCFLYIGMSRSEVHALLSKPDEKREDGDVYELGDGFLTVYEALILEYDENDLLTDYYKYIVNF